MYDAVPFACETRDPYSSDSSDKTLKRHRLGGERIYIFTFGSVLFVHVKRLSNFGKIFESSRSAESSHGVRLTSDFHPNSADQIRESLASTYVGMQLELSLCRWQSLRILPQSARRVKLSKSVSDEDLFATNRL